MDFPLSNMSLPLEYMCSPYKKVYLKTNYLSCDLLNFLAYDMDDFEFDLSDWFLDG